jgi:hypothetical protein
MTSESDHWMTSEGVMMDNFRERERESDADVREYK